ncbi:MAG: alkaline phosphatase family protein [Acidobacteria bacterium]|nr:alkaline phosphatase family protein [Acidobacteriota bacterium]MBI3484220.1 alkaline phosphatase family protein [Acidobacteriota bacterium]
MKQALRKILATIVCAGLVATSAPAQREATRTRAAQKTTNHAPKLVVVLVVDQMRGDYIERYGHQWTKGLRRLVKQGAWYRQAAYTYMNTITCAGHATISTGSIPATHGVILNAWWDRETGKQVSCTEDPKARTISYGAPAIGAHSAFRLEVPTLADELRAQLDGNARVVTMAVKARAAIMLAGHRADAATWFDAGSGAWVTTSAFTAAPVPFVESFLKSHPVERDFGKVWTRVLPESAYLFKDAEAGERPPEGWSEVFPHPLEGKSEKPDAQFYRLWAESPFADAYVGEMAAATVDALGLGKGPGTDYLAMSFGALDSVGHAFGPQSHEVQDTLVRLDETIGKLLAHLDHAVGAKNYVVAFSADHGVAPIPEQMMGEGIEAGRVATSDVIARVEKAMEPLLGAGKHVARMTYPDLYFMSGVYAKLQADATAMAAVKEAIRGVPGVWRVYRSEELENAKGSGDAIMRAIALSYYPGRSGDMVVVPKPYWFLVNEAKSVPAGSATTHGTPHGYDQHVPVILMGNGIKGGEYLNAASPADIAPTLAFLCAITLARADGRVLAEALEMPRSADIKATMPSESVKKQ